MALRDVLFPALQREFPRRGLLAGTPPRLVAVFPASCAEVGDVKIYGDEDEVTVLIENVTHHHVDPWDTDMSEDERGRWITEEVVEFLRDLFADRVLLWSIRKGAGGGGWQRPYDGSIPADVPAKADVFVWSRRIRNVG